ncbi:zinc finger BED domain-containing protein RICESLEEPER 3-like [Argentina anserina]|uniref:zinc finger BED domain-containing protein RICESLEEPER 3-like n=1 Tax=Argentina anserina TaxID=57926 RepID=UPI0021768494|nr:zinc finger BED domain-containing protein RICESLEEPER 3-like [Potentilla anserina]
MGRQRIRMIGSALGRGRQGMQGRGTGAQVDTTLSHSRTSSSSPSVQSTAHVEEHRNISLLGPPPAPELPPRPPPPTPAPEPQHESQPESSSHPSCGRKIKEPVNKSRLWEFFTRCRAPNGEVDLEWCTCNTCGTEVLCAVRRNGTSSMWNHVRKCESHQMYGEANKQTSESDSKHAKLNLNNVSGGKPHRFNKQRINDLCIEMIIKDELPFRHVENDGLKAFVNELQPHWIILNRRQVAKSVLDKFNHKKTILLNGLKASDTRISITADTWTSIQNINYMVVTAHFMDVDWKLHKRIINFCPIVSHKGDDIGRAVEQCLRQWEISKVFSITIDNTSANDVAVQYMKRRLKGYKTLVKDGLKELEKGITTIWNCAKYVRSSSARLDKFREFAGLEQCMANANVPLDVITRWNNTFLMLQAALKYEAVFGRMAEEDALFRSYFEDKIGPPNYENWRDAESFCLFLKKFYEATIKLSAWKSVTTNILFVEMITLQTEIDKACDSPDPVLKKVALSMKAKFDKYWGSFEVVNKVVMIANVLDPRYKLQWAKVPMKKVKTSPQVIESIEADLKKVLMKIYVNLLSKGFEIAKWWKGNEATYPVLSKLAKDIFAIPCSTVASENAFSLRDRVVDPFRASLTPRMVEALVCTSDWLRADPPNLYRDPTEEDLKFYYELEELERESGFNDGQVFEAPTPIELIGSFGATIGVTVVGLLHTTPFSQFCVFLFVNGRRTEELVNYKGWLDD